LLHHVLLCNNRLLRWVLLLHQHLLLCNHLLPWHHHIHLHTGPWHAS
jgi:hypothetical protein